METKIKINKSEKTNLRAPGVKWNPWIGVLLVFVIYILSQVVGLVTLIYPVLNHFSAARTSSWLSHSIYAQFFYVLIVESFTIGSVFMLLKWFKVDKKVIGLRKPNIKDPLYALIGAPIYYVIYVIAIVILSSFIKGLNVTQTQNVGFNNVHGVAELIVTLISLVILPPLAEEILVRGFLYSSLKKGLPQIVAAIVTSLIFASAHLPEGVGGLLWVGFIDTFILSMVLVYLREKTNGLYSGMMLHALKNGVAFYVLYLAPLITLHI